jgi:hypothetical protein
MTISLFRRSPFGTSASEEARARAVARASHAQAADFCRVRSPSRPQDQVLSAVARRWLATLPSSVLPRELCAQYPRIANRLALCWSDARLTEQVFDSLLVDRRGGRRGFSKDVREELMVLDDYHRHQRRAATAPQLDGLDVVESFDQPWDTRTMAMSER